MEPAALSAVFGTTNSLPNFEPRFNLGPGQDALVVRHNPDDGTRHLDPLFWGFIPPWAKDIRRERKPINARAETIATSPLFKDAFAKRRCLVPAAAFFEWRRLADGKRKQPYAIARADGETIALGGIWSGHKGEGGVITRSFAIVTTTANAMMSEIHDRMPVVIERADWPLWMGETVDETLGDLIPLLRPAAADALRLWPVSTQVNNIRNNTPGLLDEQREVAPDGGPNPQ